MSLYLPSSKLWVPITKKPPNYASIYFAKEGYVCLVPTNLPQAQAIQYINILRTHWTFP